MGAALLVSSCMTGAGAGAYAGSSLGSIIGSAIGGISGGPRGSDIGTLVGMASGAIVGAAVGNAADKQQAAEYTPEATPDVDPSQMMDNSNSGDDRIDIDFGPQNATSAQHGHHGVPSMNSSEIERIDNERLEIRNVHFVDDSGDGTLKAGEMGKLTFEIYNHSQHPALGIVPTVVEAEQNRYIYISPSILVESISPGQGIRYTASIKADRKIKDGEARLMVSAMRGGEPASYTTVVKVATAKK